MRKRWTQELVGSLALLSVIAVVALAYAFFATAGTFRYRTRTWDAPASQPGEGYYAALAEGFRRGHLSLPHVPDPALTALPDPYDARARQEAHASYLWDASYLNGRYYLYFTPLPALLVYLPFRAVAGAYPTDAFAATVFAVWALGMMAAFVRGALAGRERSLPMPVAILALGLANVIPFVLVFARTYEVAALCGAAMSATWAWSLLRYLESPRASRLVWSGVWLGLAIAARPNLTVILPVVVAAIAIGARHTRDRLKSAAAAAIPLAVIAAALMLYNQQRFGDPLEFGARYQLTETSMAGRPVCSVRNFAEVLRVCNTSSEYLFSSPAIGGRFPFVTLPVQWLDPAVSYHERSEQVGGLAALFPLAMVGSLFAAVLALRRPRADSRLLAGVLVTAAGWLVLAGLSTCWFMSARYEIDFWLLVAGGSLVCLEAGLALLAEAGVRVMPLRIAALVAALYSILLGVLLGFQGTNGSFAKLNPALFERIASLF